MIEDRIIGLVIRDVVVGIDVDDDGGSVGGLSGGGFRRVVMVGLGVG